MSGSGKLPTKPTGHSGPNRSPGEAEDCPCCRLWGKNESCK